MHINGFIWIKRRKIGEMWGKCKTNQ